MPVKKYNRRYRRKRPAKKVRAIKRNGIVSLNTNKIMGASHNMSLAKLGRGLPEAITGTLPWSLTGTMTLFSTTASNIAFCLNSLFDPGQSLSVSQPLAYDRLSPLYRAYYVYGATVTLQVINNGGSYPIQVDWVAHGTETITTQVLTGAPYTDHAILGLNDERKVWKFYVDNYRVTGLKNNKERQGNPLVATVGGDPGIKSYLTLQAQNLNSATQTIYYSVNIDYHYVMFDQISTQIVDA